MSMSTDKVQVHPYEGGNDLYGDEHAGHSHIVKKVSSPRRGSVVGRVSRNNLQQGNGSKSPRSPSRGRSMRRGSLHPMEMQHHIIAAAFSGDDTPQDEHGVEGNSGGDLDIPHHGSGLAPAPAEVARRLTKAVSRVSLGNASGRLVRSNSLGNLLHHKDLVAANGRSSLEALSPHAQQNRHLVAQNLWKRAGHKVIAVQAFNRVNDNVKVFGTKKKAKDIDWEKVYSQDMSTKPWFIILPDTQEHKYWDLLLAALLLYVTATVPVRVCFNLNAEGIWFSLEIVIDVLFWIDILINCVTAIRGEDGLYVFEWKTILYSYGTTWFFLDVIASIPFYAIGDNSSFVNRFGRFTRIPRMLKMIRLLRLLRLLRVFKMWSLIDAMHLHTSLTRAVKVIFYVVLVTHLVGCLWFLIPSFYEEDDPRFWDSWIVRNELHYDSVSEATQYLASIYWAFSTLTTIGFGDISASTEYERIFAIFVMILGVSWYAFILSTMSSIMASFDRRNTFIRKKMDQLDQFLSDANIPKLLKTQCRDYFQFRLAHNKQSHGYNVDYLLAEMSPKLRTELLLFMNKNIIAKIPFFKDKTPQFICDCVVKLQPVRFKMSETILREKEYASEMYFLTKGRVEVSSAGGKALSLVEGSYFGEVGCLLGDVRRATITCVTACEAFALEKKDLVELLHEYADVAEEIKAVALERLERIRKEQMSSGHIIPLPAKPQKKVTMKVFKPSHESSADAAKKRLEVLVEDHKRKKLAAHGSAGDMGTLSRDVEQIDHRMTKLEEAFADGFTAMMAKMESLRAL